MQGSMALVSRSPRFRETNETYLQVADDGSALWVADPMAATRFESMREAARVAFRLPADLKAYGVPLQPEIGARQVVLH